MRCKSVFQALNDEFFPDVFILKDDFVGVCVKGGGDVNVGYGEEISKDQEECIPQILPP